MHANMRDSLEFVRQVIEAGLPWVDLDFPPEAKSIMQDRDDNINALDNADDIRWYRANQLFDNL